MQYVSNTASALVLGAALHVAGASAALAQGLPGGASSLNESHGDWSVVCTVPEEKARCVISQTHVQNENRQRVLAIELTAAEDGEAASGVLVMPFGLKLDEGVSFGIDEAAPFQKLRFSTCLPAGCIVQLAFDADTISMLRGGASLAIKATTVNAQEVSLAISLNGFASALARAAELGPSG